MIPNPATTTSSTPGPQPAPSAPATPPPPPTPVQILWEVAGLAFGLLARIHNVLRPVQARFPKQAWQLARLFIDIPRIFLTIRFAPERVTLAQLRHLHRARHILQALLGYTLPTLGPRTSSSATPASTPSPSPNTQSLGPRTPSSATTPSPAAHAIPAVRKVPAVPAIPAVRKVPAVREVPEVPLVSGLSSHKSPAAASAHTPASSPGNPLSAIGNLQSAISDSQPSSPQSAIHNPQSSFPPYIPDFHTLSQALKSATLPPNCAGALFENPGDALVRALQQLHAVYFSLYPNQSPTQSPSPSPSPSQSVMESPSPSQSPSSGNLQSTICNQQSPSVHPVHNVHSVHNVHLGQPAPP